MAENRNPLLKQAFEEAARREIDILTKEGSIIDYHNNRAEALFTSSEPDKSRKHFKRTVTFIVAAVITMAFLAVGSFGIAERLGKDYIFSSAWRDSMKDNIVNTSNGMNAEEFDAELERSTDPFVAAGRESGSVNRFLLDYTQSIEYNSVIDEDEGYRFELTSITKARQKRRHKTGGNISDGTAIYEWQVSDGYYAIVEVSRVDGNKLTQEERSTHINLQWNYILAGYSPSLTNLHFKGGAIYSYSDDYRIYFAVEITEMMPFAKTDFALIAIGSDWDRDSRDMNKDTLYSDADGNLALVNEDEYFGVLLRFKAPDKYASDDERYGEKYFGVSSNQLTDWERSYQKNKAE